MEKTISQEERIRRAEEIYYKRKNASKNSGRVSSITVNPTRNKISLFKKMILQLVVCSFIYVVFYIIKNSNYIFSDNVVNKTRELLSYDINFGNVYSQVTEFINNNKDKLQFMGGVNENQEVTNQDKNEEVKNEETNTEKPNSTEGEGKGGADTKDNTKKSNEETKKWQRQSDTE